MTSKTIAVMAATLTIASATASHAREPAPAADTGEPSSIPAALGPYVHDGRFEPGDFAWARGYFASASPEQAAAVAAIDAWQDACLERNRRHAVEELGALGQGGARLEHASIGDGLCNQFYVPKHDRYDSFADFRAALETTQPIVRSFLAAVEMTDVRAAPRTTELADQLHFHTLAEQMIRSAFGWAGPVTTPPARRS